MIKIAILDTYVPAKKDMPEFLQKYYKHIEVYSHSVLTKDQQTISHNLEHANSHGSHVLFHATRSIWGTPENPVEVHCIECLDHLGRGTVDDFVEALKLCKRLKINIGNASLGFDHIHLRDICRISILSRDLIDSGAILIAAAGNEGIDPVTGQKVIDSICYPAKLGDWWAVGSDENGNWRAPYSSIGKQLLWTFDGTAEKSMGLDGLKIESGTSFSAPDCTGTVARLWMEIDKLERLTGIKIQNRREFIMGHLCFSCYRKDRNKYEMIQWEEENGCGSLKPMYNAMCTSYDLYVEDNTAGALMKK